MGVWLKIARIWLRGRQVSIGRQGQEPCKVSCCSATRDITWVILPTFTSNLAVKKTGHLKGQCYENYHRLFFH
jgi:hypothetical protein